MANAGLVVVSWNVHEGRGEIAKLLSAIGSTHVVLLVQEATDTTIPAIAAELGLYAVYAPSMRNRRGGDRGSAILSTLPLTDPIAIELPWVRQRRVAVMATVRGRLDAAPLQMRAVSVHLDNRPGRRQQSASFARWLAPYVSGEERLIVGGDLNTWFGRGEETVRQIEAVVPLVRSCGSGPTFRFHRRLDYVFYSGPDPSCEIDEKTYGSDHHPVIVTLLRRPG